MQMTETSLQDVMIVTPRRFGDERGWFQETWNKGALTEAGIVVDWVQDNHSYSAAKGTIRGLHYQAPPHAQAKLVRCTRGAIRDVAADFRHGSPTFGRWVAIELSAENGQQLFIPRGFLHGFVTLTDHAEVHYKCDAPYAPQSEGSVRWDDPTLAIDWQLASLGLEDGPHLSQKDSAASWLQDVPGPFVWGS